MLKIKKGLAYEVVKSLGVNEEKLIENIIRPIEKQMSETLFILKLAKEEARRLGRNSVGTEMFLLGIIGEGANVASEVLNDLEVTFKEYADKKEVYLVAASSAPDEITKDWIAQIEEAFPDMEVLCDDLSLGVSCHIGYGGLGIGLSCRPKRIKE